MMRRLIAVGALLCAFFAGSGFAQVNPAVVGGMKWRQAGPFRGGHLLAVHLFARFRPGARVAHGAVAGSAGGDHGGLYGCGLLRGEPLLAEGGNDA